MINTVARLVTRLQGEGDGLIIGALMRSGEGKLKPNYVYELRDILGSIELIEVGPAGGTDPGIMYADQSPENGWFNWGCGMEYIMDSQGGKLFLTRDEYRQLVEETKREL